MKRSQVLLMLLIVVITASLVSRVYFTKDSTDEVVMTIPVQAITFLDTNNTIVRLTTGDTAVFNGLGFNDITLEPIFSEPSQQYRDQSSRLHIIHTDDKITVSDTGTVLFTGATTDRAPVDTVLDEEVPLSAASTAPLHRTWVWQGNDMVTKEAARDFSITFRGDNSFFGTTDCNDFSGSYTNNESRLTMTNIASTKMFCTDTYGDTFITTLASVSEFSISEYSFLLLVTTDETLEFTQGLETN